MMNSTLDAVSQASYGIPAMVCAVKKTDAAMQM